MEASGAKILSGVAYVPVSRVNDAGLVDFQEVLPAYSQ